MSTPNSPAQPLLLPAETLAAAVFFEKLERTTGDYTAERLRTQRPADYQLVVAMLARGYGSQKIQDEFHRQEKKLSKNTVKAVRAIEGETIDLLRERLSRDCLDAADADLEAGRIILEEILENKYRREKLTIRDVQSLRVSAGIAIQNAQLLTGLPTARVQLEEIRRPDHEDFSRFIAALPSAGEAETTHLLRETAGQKEGGARKALGVPSANVAGSPDAQTQSDADCESEGNQNKP